MPSQKYRVSLTAPLAAQLTAFAEEWAVPTAAVMRDALIYLLEHPDLYPTILGKRLGTLEDKRSPEQRAAWEQDREQFEGVDLERCVQPLPPPR